MGIIGECVLVLVLAAVLFLRCLMRQIRLRKWKRLPYKERVTKVYSCLLKSFKKLGFAHKSSATPLEYAFDKQDEMTPFTKDPVGDIPDHQRQ